MAAHPTSTPSPQRRRGRIAAVGARPRPRRSSLLRPRDWRVRTKLGAVLAIPTIAFVVVAGLFVNTSVRQANELAEFADQVAFGQQVTALIHELQFERDRLTGELAAIAAAPAAADRQRIEEATAGPRERVQHARDAFDRAAAALADRPDLGPAITLAEVRLDELEAVRTGARDGWLRGQAVFDGYSLAIGALLDLLVPATSADDPQVRGYLDLAALKEMSAQVRGRVFAVASAGGADPATLDRLTEIRVQRSIARDRFRSGSTADQLDRFDQAMRGQAVRGSARLEQVVADQAAAGAVEVDPEQWWAAATTELELIREVETALLDQAHQRVAEASAARWRQTALTTGATVIVLLISLLLSIGIGRSMATSLRRLRAQAMQVAHSQLPGLLARLRSSRDAQPDVDQVRRVDAGGADEVGDVADAFTQVHRSAVQLAVEQAVMRRNVNAIFVNLARRSQVLVERQLELLDELEQEEADPAQLRNLFRLDHLATRMRRNNESLLVLAGTDPTRPYNRPVSLAAIALAAIAEIEQYGRVREDLSGEVHVVGRAVADLVHLLAELLDNATSFSARDTAVTITGEHFPDWSGAMVEVVDAGMGMSPAAVAEANSLLAEPPVIDVAASERMGLVVVGHLAARHGVQVTLAADESGTRARVWLPGAVLAMMPTGAEAATLRMPLLVADDEIPGRRAVRAEDVLAGGDAESPSTWWTGAQSPAPPDPNPVGGPGMMMGAPAATGNAEPALGAAPEPADRFVSTPVPVVGGVSSRGLPIRIPQAQLPGGGATTPRTGPGWQSADPDPDHVGQTLARYYSGVRRAEEEESEVEADPTPELSGTVDSPGSPSTVESQPATSSNHT